MNNTQKSFMPLLISAAVMASILDLFSISVFLPALPSISRAFHFHRDTTQFSIPIFLIGVALSQFIWGYVADRYGSKKTLLILIPTYILGCLISAFSASIQILFFGLFMQGFGLGGIFSISQAIIGDNLPKHKLAPKLAVIGLFATWAAAVGAMIGGYLNDFISWRATFLFLAAFALVVFSIFIVLPKDNVKSLTRFSLRKVAIDYYKIYSKRQYIRYVLVVAFMNAGLYIFMTISPFLFIHDFHISAKFYGVMLVIPIAGLFLGRIINIHLSKFYNNDSLIKTGSYIALISSILMLMISLTALFNPYTVMLSMAIFNLGLGINGPSARASAIHIGAILIGTAASLLSVSVNLVGVINSIAAARLIDGYMALCILLVSILNLIFFFVLRPKKENNDSGLINH